MVVASPSARAACALNKIAELPVTMSGPQGLVAAKINGADVVFVADSGAFFSTISPGNAAALKLPLSPAPNLHVFGVGGEAEIQVGTVRTLTLAGADFHNIPFIVGGSETSERAVGLLGQNVLRVADVEYDFGDGFIRLIKPQGCGNLDLLYWAHGRPYSMAQIEWSDSLRPHTVTTALVNGAHIRVILDTGSAVSVLSLGAARRAGIRTDSPSVERSGFMSGLGRTSIQTWTAPVSLFEIGDEKIQNTRLLLGDLNGIDADMLLGADFFLSHRVLVSNSQKRVYFTYEGGSVFSLKPKPPPAAGGDAAIAATGGVATGGASSQQGSKAEEASTAPPDASATPTDAEGYSRRGAALASRREYGQAIADFGEARRLAPKTAQYAYQLALAHLGAGQPALAAPELDAAISLDPRNAEVLIARASLRAATHDRTGEIADLDAASALLPKPAHLRLALAELYLGADQYDRAIAESDLWIDAHPADSRRSLALNERCWARALADRELGKALSDCNAALWGSQNPAILDSRGLVRLRRGELDRAIADYDAALRLNPKIAWSLYGRGLAELRRGDAAKGRGDIEAAVKLNPKLPERAGKLGLTPEAFGPRSVATSATPTTSQAVPSQAATPKAATSQAASPPAKTLQAATP